MPVDFHREELARVLRAAALDDATRLELAGVLLADRNVSKPAWRSASFWLIVASVLCAAVVAGALALKDHPGAAAVAAAFAVLGGAVQAVRNSGDARAAGSVATRKLEVAATAANDARAAAGAVVPKVIDGRPECSTCNGHGDLLDPPGPSGALDLDRRHPCPDCGGSGRG